MNLSYDFHIHTALSPCASDDMTPNNIVNMATLKGLDIIGITDHNSTENCISVIRAAENKELLVIPGVELQTIEEVHLLCFFEKISNLKDFQDAIDSSMIKRDNNIDIFGNQLVMDEKDNIIDRKQYMLLTSSGLSLNQAVCLVSEMGGVVVPAHIERKSYSIITNLGFIPEELNLSYLEIYQPDNLPDLIANFDYLRNYKYLFNSDAHALGCISEPKNFIECRSKSIFEVIKTIRDGGRYK